ncbi:OmpA family protein [Flavobacterium sp. MFBS3-15]|uniref:OmpA family protein n=1 Tax=Flavobacterium sp. MFBS3-15 TaxID=2989816 RepID=UPI002235B4B9|nr:OmpA family protein [Flavobacterium sp. MFBS3-15]MCW4467758.1 OmpA family protein [Flavobacterium sp. MFBS3-15]
MKKVVLPLLMLCLAPAALRAQEEGSAVNEYNKWSIDAAFGTNKAANPMTPGYHMQVTNLFHADLGFRYMFNNKFGLKLQGGYDVLNDDGSGSLEFETKVMSINLQGYANLGRIMDFQTWTKRLNLLGHMGIGVGQIKTDTREGGILNPDAKDRIGSFIIGMTGQFRITDRVAFNADFTMYNNFSQHRTWDGGPYNNEDGSQKTFQGFDSTLYTATLGLSIYLGKHEKHADWYVEEKSNELIEMEDRLAELETMMNDTDKDGVPDYLDSEPNTITGVAVDSKGRTIDRNQNGVPDELESYIENNNKQMEQKIQQVGAGVEQLINDGYVNVYFDFNKDTPNAQSVNGINFLIKYLKENPNKSADVIGYADEVGNSDYNKDLSERRAKNVKQILVDAGIEEGRLNIVGNGSQSLGNDTKAVRQTVRRVTFVLK